MQEEGSATDTGRLRLDEPQYGLHRDSGVDGRTALAQHFKTRLNRQRVGRGHHGTRLPLQVRLGFRFVWQPYLSRLARALCSTAPHQQHTQPENRQVLGDGTERLEEGHGETPREGSRNRNIRTGNPNQAW